MERRLLSAGFLVWLTLGTDLFPVIAQTDYAGTVLSQGPRGYYRLNEMIQPSPFPSAAANVGSLGNLADGELISDILTGEAGAVAGDSSYRFTNPGWDVTFVGSRVDVPFEPALNPSGPFTVEFWARPYPGATDLFSPLSSLDVESNGGAARAGYIFYYDGASSRWEFRVGDLNGYRGVAVGGTAPAQTWRHVVGVFSGSSVRLYVNGELASEVPVVSFAPNGNQPLRIGGTTVPNRGFSGWIDEVAFYDGVLTPATVREHFLAATNGSVYAALVRDLAPRGYWRFGEPGDPKTQNLGSLGTEGDGRYAWPIEPGVFGPAAPSAPGFEANNSAFRLDGLDGHITLPPLNFRTNGLTFSAWVNPGAEQVRGAGLLVNRSGTTASGLTLGSDLGSLELSYFWNGNPIGSQYGTGLLLPDNTWSFVALVVESAGAVAYLGDLTTGAFLRHTNAVPHGLQTFAGVTQAGTDPAFPSRTFNGALDELAVFDRTLSIGEVYTQFAAAIGGRAAVLFSDPQPELVEIQEGNTFAIEVDAGGTPELQYQWYRNGAALPGATSRRLSRVATLEDQGTFHVAVRNQFGEMTSGSAQVNVTPLGFPFILTAPVGRSVFPGGRLQLDVVATGGGLQYQWVKDGVDLPGATNSSYLIPSVTLQHVGQYLVRISNSYGDVASRPAALEVLVPAPDSYEAVIIEDQPYSWWRMDDPPFSKTMVDSMGRLSGYYTNTGSGITFRSEGVVRNGAVASDGSMPFFGVVPFQPALGSSAFTFECWARLASRDRDLSPLSFYNSSKRGHFIYADAESGKWRMGVGAGDDPALFYYLGDIPSGKTDLNRWTHLVMTCDGLSVRWYVNGEASEVYGDFPRNLTAPLLVGGVGPDVDYPFHGVVDEVLFYPRALPEDRVRAHFLAVSYPEGSAPIFTEQPAPAAAIVGDSARFTARVEGTAPIRLRWFKDGQPLLNQDEPTLAINAVTFGDYGLYQLEAANSRGTNLSPPVLLSVYPFPTFAGATNDLVLHLPLDGGFNDDSGRGHDALLVNAPPFVSGRVGSQALRLVTDSQNNTYRYASLGAPEDFRFSSNVNFSVAYWVRLPVGATPGDLPFLGTALNAYGYPGFTFGPSYGEGGWAYSLNGKVQVFGAPGSINDGQWHHLVHSFERGGEGLTFLDGALVDSRPVAPAGNVDVPNALTIGQDPSGMYPETATFDLDDIGIWRRALTPAEAKAIYHAGRMGNSFDTYGPVLLEVIKSGGRWMLVWQAGTLLESDNVDGPWSPVLGAVAPNYWLPPIGPTKKFYRAVL